MLRAKESNPEEPGPEEQLIIQVGDTGDGDNDNKKNEATPYVQMLQTAVYIVIFMVVGPTLILVNKHILSELNFKFPMLVAGLGQAMSAFGSWIVFSVLKLVPLEKPELEPDVRRSMWVVGACSAGTLYFGNAVYIYLSVAFCQILKSYTPAVTLVLLMVFGVDYPSKYVTFSVVGMCVATSLAVNGELQFDTFGVILMMASSVCEATKLVLTQKLMVNNKFPALESLYRMAPICTAWLFVASALTEAPVIMREGKYMVLIENWHVFLASALLGYAINMVSFFVVKRVGALTLKLLATARNASLVVCSVIFFGDIVTANQFMCYAGALAFFTLYNYLKLKKM